MERTGIQVKSNAPSIYEINELKEYIKDLEDEIRFKNDLLNIKSEQISQGDKTITELGTTLKNIFEILNRVAPDTVKYFDAEEKVLKSYLEYKAIKNM